MDDHQIILAMLDQYFQGVYRGDIAQLRAVFHPDAQLFGEIRGQRYHKRLDDYLDVVSSRKSPQDLEEPFLMKPVTVEVMHNIAFAKAQCPMLGFNYVDYLSFARTEGTWRIVSKVFTDIPD